MPGRKKYQLKLNTWKEIGLKIIEDTDDFSKIIFSIMFVKQIGTYTDLSVWMNGKVLE